MPARRRTLTLTALCLAAALVPPASAQARHVIAPPGNSGVEQYVEVVPSAEGNVPVGGSGAGHGGSLAKATEHRLQASGSEGRAAAAFAQRTGSGRAAPAHHHRSAGGSHSNGAAAGGGKGGGSGGSPPPIAPAVQSAAQSGAGGGGLGAGLPIALGAIALIAAAAFLIRRRAG